MDSTERSLLVAHCVEKVEIAAHMGVLVKFIPIIIGLTIVIHTGRKLGILKLRIGAS